ncbi:MAG: tryptophan 2,3-dioxygenase family protein [Blastomonas sp.]
MNGGAMQVKRTIEDGVETFEAQIDGETIRWDGGLTYANHLKTDALLATQVPVSDKPDEMLFIIMHQTMELWIKLILHELYVGLSQLRNEEYLKLFKTIDRITTVQRHMIQSWEVLATLTPHDFMTFRGYLRKASGFQSHQYRELEFLLGNKRADLTILHRDNPPVIARLEEVLKAPSLYDEVLMLLSRKGFAIPADHLDRDWAEPYSESPAVEDAWLAIYSDVEQHYLLYQLGEKLASIEYYFHEWRFKHMKTVSRVIGHKPGTGGSSGVNYLVKALNLRFFPELWAMRTRMVPMPESDGA